MMPKLKIYKEFCIIMDINKKKIYKNQKSYLKKLNKMAAN